LDKGLLEAAFYLQAAVLGKGYDDFGILRPVGQDFGGFKDFKGGGGPGACCASAQILNKNALLCIFIPCRLPKEPVNRDFLHIYAKNPQVQQAPRGLISFFVIMIFLGPTPCRIFGQTR
jgi:hypothetical protein